MWVATTNHRSLRHAFLWQEAESLACHKKSVPLGRTVVATHISCCSSRRFPKTTLPCDAVIENCAVPDVKMKHALLLFS